MMKFDHVYRGRRVLITGHTGFKGSWLALWLHQCGAQVTGIALDPAGVPNHWSLLGLDVVDHRQDIRDFAALLPLVQRAAPEIVFHLAAQPLVRRSYADPLTTWSTNVMGTANILEACRQVAGVKAVVAITTDKVYANQEWPWGYRENDRLGGHDPYSASKAACELLIESTRKSFSRQHAPLLASARAGNVIGGGDWSEDRLIPDMVRAVGRGQPGEIRSPQATRPWQHVLECLAGYLMLGEKLLNGEEAFAQAWNFGPSPEGNQTVAVVLDQLKKEWPALAWHSVKGEHPHEANLLYLDSAKARRLLGWVPVWSLAEALHHTAAWYRAYMTECRVLSVQQLAAYLRGPGGLSPLGGSRAEP